MAPVVFRFGPFVLDPAAYRLSREDVHSPLSPKAIDLLLLFVKRPSLLLTKDEIFSVLWPDVAVTDNALTQVVSELRQALGDNPAAPQYLQTVARRGYRFVAPVTIGPMSVSEVTPPPVPVASRPGQRAVIVLNFSNVTNDVEMSWLAAGIAETITNDLRAIRDLRVLDRVPVAQGGDPVAEAARTVGVDLVIVGSFQRAGDRLRITARAVEVSTREAIAHAKADGALAEVFGLQDAIVTQLSTGLKITVTSSAARRISAHETSSLDAYRAATEGRLKLETLDPGLVPGAIADFERALKLDPDYALAHVGLAHARFWRFQASRAQNRPDRAELVAALTHARRGVEIDPELAEGHAALALLLSSADRHREATAAGRLAVAIEPGNWRHQFRLGIAAWGHERLGCLDAVLEIYPRLTYAHFGIAMVHVARGDLRAAAGTLEAGLAQDDGSSPAPRRFPANGLHWLLGLIRLAEGDRAAARAEFDRELQSPGSRLFVDEFAMDAHDGHAFVLLDEGDAVGAAGMFEQALLRFPAHARSLVGLGVALRRLGAHDRAADAATRAAAAIAELQTNGRETEAAMATALDLATSGRHAEAIDHLSALLANAAIGPGGWTLPIEPLLSPLANQPAYAEVLAKLAERAR